MPPELTLPAAFLLAAIVTWIATLPAIALARSTGFMDRPVGYKSHRRPTPYLGGSAVMLGVLVAGLTFGGATGAYLVLVACAAAMWALGTVDDRLNLSPYLRVAGEAGVGAVLHVTGNGWAVFDSGLLDLVLTCVWVVGLVNAVNLMDNMDGAAATVTAVSAAGAGALAALSSQPTLAALCLAIAGACAGFLPHNIARPARVFLGDGGSMPLGLLLAGVTMVAVSEASLGAAGLPVAAMVVGVVILDTTLVIVSRRRGRRALLTGGCDHLTHRLHSRLGSSRAVAARLSLAQLGLCVLAVVLVSAHPFILVLSASLMAVLGARVIWHLEGPPWFDQPHTTRFVVDTGQGREVAVAPESN